MQIKKILINRSYTLLYTLMICGLTLNSCEQEWLPSDIEIKSGKTSLTVEVINSTTGNAASQIAVSIYAKPMGQNNFELLHEGVADENGILVIPEVEYPNIVQIDVMDDRYPPLPQPESFKVLTSKSAFITMQVSKDWTEQHIYDRSEWNVIAASSEQTEGLRQNILKEGDAVWHSEYSPDKPDFPHWLIIDMQEERTIHGFAFRNRANLNGAIKDLEVLISDDGEGWASLTELTLALTSDWQLFTLPEESEARSRYIKLLFKTSHPGVHFANLAEFGVY